MPSWLDDDLADRRRRNLYRVRRRSQSGPGRTVRLNGQELLNFAANDYLGLAADLRLARAAARAARRYGCGAGASPLITGSTPPVRALERALARWEGTEAALVFGSGFVANLAVLSSLAGREDALFSDALNHASLIDGCRLSRAAVHVYRHADAGHLDTLLGRHAASARRRFIVTDSVFSMDGDLAPVTDLIDLARRHDAVLILDEAHATGVFGEHGRGLAESLAADLDRIIKVGTLSKALGAQGGFVCGTRGLVNWLVNHARPYVFSTAVAPPTAAAARRAVAIVQREPGRRRHLLGLAALLRDRLQAAGFPATGSCSQIVPIRVGSAGAALELSARLEERGLLVPAIRPPSVPEGQSRLRVSLTAVHSEDDVLRLVDCLRACRQASVSPPCSR